MFFTPALFKGRTREPYGEFTFYSSYLQGGTWTVPEGVTSISVLCVCPGQRAGTGYGGALRWTNNISVIPGDIYTITFSTGSSPYALFRSDRLNMIFCQAVGRNSGVGTGFNGAPGNTGAAYPRSGGGAAGMTQDGLSFLNGVSSNSRGGGGVNPFVGNAPPGRTGLGGTNAIGADFGGGTGVDSGSATGVSAGQGCVRIIWGKVDGVPRAFPNTGVEPIPYRSYTEWLAHIATRAPKAEDWSRASSFWNVAAPEPLRLINPPTVFSGSMTGSSFGARGYVVGASGIRILQHAARSQEVIEAVRAAGGEVLIIADYTSNTQAYQAITRNGYTSTSGTKDNIDAARVVTELSYWNPILNMPETMRPNLSQGPFNYSAEGW